MPRHQYKKRSQKNDPIYKSREVAKLINYIMLDGKKNVAQAIVYDVLEMFKKENKDPIKTLNLAIDNVAPVVEARPRRLGGASYLVPAEVRKERKLFLALNWIVDAATARSSKEFKTFSLKLYHELLDASKNQGQAISKRTQVEKVAEANKAFSHLKW